MEKQAIAALIVITVLLGVVLIVMPASAYPMVAPNIKKPAATLGPKGRNVVLNKRFSKRLTDQKCQTVWSRFSKR